MKSEAAITFSFGKNWRDFVDTVDEAAVERARQDIQDWLGADVVTGKSVLDIGSGSGIHSLSFYLLGAKEVFSFDVDRYSVESTRILKKKAGDPENWSVTEGSILNESFLASVGQYDIVYSWGVLHHTGAMWKAIENASRFVKPGGLFWIAIYVKTPAYPQELELKESYNRASKLGKKRIEWTEIYKVMKTRWRAGGNPFTWNEKRQRGMDTHHDLLDWLGGLPYEVATADEVIQFCEARGFTLQKVDDRESNIVYLFSRG